MSRKSALLPAFLCILLLSVGGCDQGTKNLGGPVAIVDGPAPTHGFLGIVFDPNEPGLLLVVEIVPGTPLATSNLRVGDTVLTIDNMEVDNYDSLVALLKETVPQQVVDIGFLQDGEEQVTRVELLSFTEFVLAQERARNHSGEQQGVRHD